MACLFQVNSRSGVQALHRVYGLSLIAFFFLACQGIHAADRSRGSLASRGYGFFGNRELRRILRTLELSGRIPAEFPPGFVEDAALVLASRVKRDGHLHPKIMIRLVSSEGKEMEIT